MNLLVNNHKDFLNSKGLPDSNKLKLIDVPDTYQWCKNKSEYIYCIKEKITKKPICPECGEKRNFVNFTKGHSNYCSLKCFHNSEKTKEKKKQTCLENYGVENPSQSEEIKEKKKQTCLENYGVSVPSKSPIVKDKMQKTMLKIYGVSFPAQSPIVKDKMQKTCLEKYNVDNYFKLINKERKVSEEEMTDFQIYHRRVSSITRQQKIESLPNFKKRDNHAFNEDAYHLDHKYSIKQGFLDNIPPYIIGDLSNLEIIPFKENLSKNSKCSIAKNELFAKIIVKRLKDKI